MKMKKRVLKIITLIAIIILFGFNLYQRAQLKEYKKALTNDVHDNLQRFASVAGNDYSDSKMYIQSYAAIDCAVTAYADLPQEKGYSEEYDNSLSALLLELKSLMLNDKEKLTVFSKHPRGH